MTVFGFPPDVFGIVLAIVFFGGLVKGLAGFGYAIASTAILATLLDPSDAVTLMTLPMLGANIALLPALYASTFKTFLRRFWPFVGAALLGTLLGMVLLTIIPTAWLAVGLGVFTLGYVLVTQPYWTIPGGTQFASTCFRPGTAAKVGLGLVSGLIFGASNIAVQVVAYLDHLSLDRATFIGVLAMILVGVSGVRVGAAWLLGLYGTDTLLLVSVIAVFPGLVGVWAGGRIRSAVPETVRIGGTLALLVVIGVRLTLVGATGL
jgi:uncharacterized membrane protein YfcA